MPAPAPADPPTPEDLKGRLRFIQQAERLKGVLRSGFGSTGRPESTAEHSWRLCLLAMALQDVLGPLDFERVLKLCVLHDLGEAIAGDVPAIAQSDPVRKAEKNARERHDFIALTASLPDAVKQEFLTLWDDYDQGHSVEARTVKALDKLETVIQHNQGANSPDFDYRFNLAYGRQLAAVHPALQALRALVDQDTAARAEGRAPGNPQDFTRL